MYKYVMFVLLALVLGAGVFLNQDTGSTPARERSPAAPASQEDNAFRSLKID